MIPASIQTLQKQLDDNRLAQMHLRMKAAKGEIAPDASLTQSMLELEANEKVLEWQIKAAWAEAMHEATEAARLAQPALVTPASYGSVAVVR